ncbi:hypothetical protein [Kineosporia babensis]|uniref:Uncharacterized protein n=1 Tax=Kineosporia babensis TaxID=499548 RepID=A0A9X1NJM1_9ACTN|nr:hypothetical protein [Kineosporia babensis]MCD5314343.1 hypothetical protein [Kineosporia babensis]
MTDYSGRQDQDSSPEGSSVPRVTCCLCRRLIPPAQEVFALDPEWQRRFPAMVGVLACEECVLETEWQCQDETGEYVAGHIPARDLPAQAQDVDSWSHLPAQGSQTAMLQQHMNPDPQPTTAVPSKLVTTRVGLTEQRTELMGLIDSWQTTRLSRSRTAK